MARNMTHAQVADNFAKAGIIQPNFKMSPDELQAHLARKSIKFASAKGKDARSRKASKSRAIAMAH